VFGKVKWKRRLYCSVWKIFTKRVENSTWEGNNQFCCVSYLLWNRKVCLALAKDACKIFAEIILKAEHDAERLLHIP
jgi:hypothetical protein